VPVIDQAFGFQTKAVMLKSGPEIFKAGNRIGVTSKTSTYCRGETGETPFLRLRSKIFAAAPGRADQLQMGSVATGYDAVMVMKAAADGAGSLAGPAVAEWLEQNASKVTGLVLGSIEASRVSHFLLGESAQAVMSRPDLLDQFGRVERLNC
jgi:hypothetical protein